MLLLHFIFSKIASMAGQANQNASSSPGLCVGIQLNKSKFELEVTWCFVKQSEAFTIQYNFKLLPSVNTLIARGMFCGAKFNHHTFTPIIKHLITTTANKHPGKKSFTDKNMRKSHWHQAVHITQNKIKWPLPEDPLLQVTVLIKAIIRIISTN